MSRNENKEYGTPAERAAANKVVFPTDRYRALVTSIYSITVPVKK